MSKPSNSNTAYAADSVQGCFEELKLHTLNNGQSFTQGMLKFNYALNARSNGKPVVELAYLTIKGLNAFNAAVNDTQKKLEKTRGCYVLYNSFTNKIYVGKSEGANSESPGLHARLNTHKIQPKLEFDTIFCVYVPMDGVEDNLSLAFTGQFLTYMEASLYKAIVSIYSKYYSNYSDFIVNQALNPIPPQNHVHLHSLVDDYAINSLLDWMTMTGFSVNPAIPHISKSIVSAVVTSSGSSHGVGGGGVLVTTPASLPGTNASGGSPSLSASSALSKAFDFSNLAKITLKNPATGKINLVSCSSASVAFQEIVGHILNCALGELSTAEQSTFFNQLAKALKVWVKCESKQTIKDFSQRTVNISDKIHKLPATDGLRICVNYDNPTKINKLNQLAAFVSAQVPSFSNKKLSDFVG